jgi:hypothetical protein
MGIRERVTKLERPHGKPCSALLIVSKQSGETDSEAICRERAARNIHPSAPVLVIIEN